MKTRFLSSERSITSNDPFRASLMELENEVLLGATASWVGTSCTRDMSSMLAAYQVRLWQEVVMTSSVCVVLTVRRLIVCAEWTSDLSFISSTFGESGGVSSFKSCLFSKSSMFVVSVGISDSWISSEYSRWRFRRHLRRIFSNSRKVSGL